MQGLETLQEQGDHFYCTGVEFTYSPSGGIMKMQCQSAHNSIFSLSASLLLTIILSILLSSCGTVIQPPTQTQSEQAQATPPQTSITSTEIPTQIPTPEIDPALETIPLDLNFMDGRNVKEMVSNVEVDTNTGLEVALDAEGSIVAYNLTTQHKNLWVVSPLIEQGFRWNFGLNENGQVVLHNGLEEWNYRPWPIGGIKYVKLDELPATFWDESDPVRDDEQRPWPIEGTLAVFDGEGDILMYYSKLENAWWFAGYQVELPGNLVYRQTSMSLALTGIRYKPVDEEVWTGPDLNERWQEIRDTIDWLAYIRRNGYYLSLENFSNRVRNGEVFEYQSWLYDLASRDYKLTTLSNQTRIYIQTTLVDRDLGNSYDGMFHARFHPLQGGNGTLLHPDNSVTIMKLYFEDTINQGRYPWNYYIFGGTLSFQQYTISFLAASDSVQKEGIKIRVNDTAFYNLMPKSVSDTWHEKYEDTDFDGALAGNGELTLSWATPIIYPYIENLHPHVKP